MQNYVSSQTHIESLGVSKIKGELIEKVVKEFESLFAAKGEKIGRHPCVEMKILTTGDPIRQRAYRAPLAKRHLIEEAVEEMLEDGIIRRSSSPYASPCLLVPKANDVKPRFCVDYTKLNAITKKDAYPLPLIQDIFDQLQGSILRPGSPFWFLANTSGRRRY